MKRIFMFVILFVFLISECLSDVYNQNEAIRKKVLKDYDKMTLPGRNGNGTANVYIGMSPKAVWIDDINQRLVVNSYAIMFWRDQRLKWDYKDFGNLEIAHFGDDELWKPDLTTYNNAAISEVDHYGNVHLLVYSSGNVIWVPPSHTETECDIDLKRWPFDTQVCTIVMGSWTSDGWQISLNLFRNETKINTDYLSKTSHNWRILDATKELITTKYECCDEPYYSVEFTFTVKRDSPTFTAIVLVPAISLPLLLMLQYILPVDHSKRLTIGFNCLLLVTLELLFLKMSLPALGTSVPLIVSYFSQMFLMVLLTIGFSAILSRISHPQHPLLQFAPPQLLKRILTGPLATVLLLKDHASKVGLSGGMSDDAEILDGSSSEPNYSHEWLLVAKAFDRIVLFLYVAIYIFSLIGYLAPMN